MLKNNKRIISVACLLTISLGSIIVASCKDITINKPTKQQENKLALVLEKISQNNDQYQLKFSVNDFNNKTIALVLNPKNDKNNKIITNKVLITNSKIEIDVNGLNKELIYELAQIQVYESKDNQFKTFDLSDPVEINLKTNKDINANKKDRKLSPFIDDMPVANSNGLNSILTNQTTLIYQKDDININDKSTSFSKENLTKKYNNQTFYFNHLSKEITNFNQDLELKKSNIKINKELEPISTSIKDNKLILEFDDKYNNKMVEINLKSYNPLIKTSKVYKQEIKNKKAELDLKELINFSNQFILTTIKINEQYNYLEYKPEFLINLSTNTKPKLIDFNFYNENNQLYGSAIFNVKENDLSLLNKQFVFYFNPKTNDDNNQHIATKKIVVNYKDLWKFPINNIFSNVLYQLSKIKVVEPNLTKSNIEVELGDKSIEFSFNQHYQDQKLTSLINNNNQQKEVIDLENANRLLSKKLNLNSATLNELLNKSKEHNQIPYSYSNFDALINYYFNKKSSSSDLYSLPKKVEIIKNNQILPYNVLMGKELLTNQIFKIDQTKNSATLTKDLSKFTNLKEIEPENIMFSFMFELDSNIKPLNLSTRLSSYQTANSRIRINIPYALLLKQKQINNVDFILNYKNESAQIQSLIRNSIIDKVQFNLNLKNNILSLEIKAKNAEINNSLVAHNLTLKRSVFVNNSDFYVHYLSDKKLQFQEKAIDELSHGLNEISVDRYDLSNNKLPNEINSTKRLFIEDQSKGIKAARERTFVLNQNFDGTWNLIGKVKPNDDNDHRYYVGTNSHIWDVIKHVYKPFSDYQTIDLNGEVYLNTPTLISKNELDKTKPLYVPDNPYNSNAFDMYWKLRYKKDSAKESNPNNWYKKSKIDLSKESDSYSIHFDYENHPLTLKLVKEYIHPINSLHTMHDNENEQINYRFSNSRYYSKLDFIVAELDVSWFFINFAEQAKQKLEYYTYKNIKLTKQQKAVVDFILNWKNLPSLELSQQQYNFNSNANLNFYLAAYPNEQSANADAPRNANSNNPIRRYREYLLAHHVNMRYDIPYNDAEFIPIMIGFWEKNTDLAAGSSGAFVYDYEGKFAGVNVAGDGDMINPYRSRDYFMLTDNQLTSFYGNKDLSNQQSFYYHIKRLSWLYPNKYEDIFNTKK